MIDVWLFQLNVYCDDQHVQGSPIPFKVHANRSKVMFDKLDRGVVGVNSELKVSVVSYCRSSILNFSAIESVCWKPCLTVNNLIQEAIWRGEMETATFIWVFHYNDQSSFHLLFLKIKLMLERCLKMITINHSLFFICVFHGSLYWSISTS